MGLLDVPGVTKVVADARYAPITGSTAYVPAAGGANTLVGWKVVTDPAYGAVHDGVTDDAPAIKAAISGGGDVLLPAGTYYFKATSTAILAPAGLRLRGVPGKTFILFDTDTASTYREFLRNAGNGVTIEGLTITRNSDFPSVMFPVQAYTGLTFTNVTLNGQRDIYSTNYCHGLQLGVQSTTTDQLKIVGCTLTKMSYGLFQASASTATTTNVWVEDSMFTQNYADDLEFNSPNATTSGVRVSGCSFSNNQVSTAGAGFAVGLAHVTGAVIERCTFTTYNNEAIHLEDYCSDVTITSNTFTTCGKVADSYIQVISGVRRVRITNNTFDTTSVATSIFIINILAGGTGTTPGGRTVIPPTYITITGNVLGCVGTVRGIYLEALTVASVTANELIGPGTVTGGVYGGTYSFALNVYSCSMITITGNLIRGFTYGLYPGNLTVGSGDDAAITGNVFQTCFLGSSLINSAGATFTGNIFKNCQYSMILGYGSFVQNSVVMTGNSAIGCTNPMSIYGYINITTSGTATTGSGKTLAVSALANVLPSGTAITFSGGGTFTTSAVAGFGAASIVGTLATANVASGESATVWLPYSTDSTKNRTIANNSDDYYGAAGFGIKLVTVSSSYKILGYEGLVVASTGGITLTLPPAAYYRGQNFLVKNSAGSAITLAATSGNVDGASTQSLAALATANAVSDGTNWLLVA